MATASDPPQQSALATLDEIVGDLPAQPDPRHQRALALRAQAWERVTANLPIIDTILEKKTIDNATELSVALQALLFVRGEFFLKRTGAIE